MQTLQQYINQFLNEADPNRQALGRILDQTRQTFDVLAGRNPTLAFTTFVDQYNWLGNLENKATYDISRNLARNLPGALMQDYLIHLIIHLLEPYPQLEVFTEVRVPFGTYPFWDAGQIAYQTPIQVADLAVGYLMVSGQIVAPQAPWPRPMISRLPRGRAVLPLVVLNSKIRVSQGEFFDWIGRNELMSKGNPNCLSIQVALRAEMDLQFVRATQANDKFFLLGRGDERNVIGNATELERLIHTVSAHIQARMT